MEIKIQIDRKTGIVLLVAFVAGLIGGLIGSCIMMKHMNFRTMHMGFGGGDHMMRLERIGEGNVFYGTSEMMPEGGTIEVGAMPAQQ